MASTQHTIPIPATQNINGNYKVQDVSGDTIIKNKENFDDVFKRLLLVREFRGAYYELRVALSLLKLGVSFGFLNPSDKKTPDIKIISDTRPMFIEITKKNVPEEYTCRSKNYNRILNFLFSKTSEKNLDFCCDIQRLLSTPRSEKKQKPGSKGKTSNSRSNAKLR